MPSPNLIRDDELTNKYISMMLTEPPYIYPRGGLCKQSRVLEKLEAEYHLGDSHLLHIVTVTKKRWKQSIEPLV